MMYLEVVGGFVLLLGGAELMVRGAVGLADRFGISKLVIGMTVVAFGTSAPELLVSLNAALAGSSGLAIGNVVGSNIANILLVLGVAGLIMPMATHSKSLKADGAVLLVGTAAFMALSYRGVIDLIGAVVLLVLFAGFIYYSYWREQRGEGGLADDVDDFEAVPHSLGLAIVLLILGFAGLIAGAEFLVDGGVQIARSFGLSEAVIGLTIIAFGTSLPELAASAVAAFRRHADMALGNIVGSNIFNIVGIMGVVGVVTPLDIPARVLNMDIWIMAAATLLLMPYMIGGRHIFSRPEAMLFIIVYIGYIASMAFGVERILPV